MKIRILCLINLIFSTFWLANANAQNDGKFIRCSTIAPNIQPKIKAKLLEKGSNRWIGYTNIKGNNVNTDPAIHSLFYYDGSCLKEISSVTSYNSHDLMPRNNPYDFMQFPIMQTMHGAGEDTIEFCAKINGDEGFLIFVLCAPFAGVPYLVGVGLLPIDFGITLAKGGFSAKGRATNSLFNFLYDLKDKKISKRKFKALLSIFQFNK